MDLIRRAALLKWHADNEDWFWKHIAHKLIALTENSALPKKIHRKGRSLGYNGAVRKSYQKKIRARQRHCIRQVHQRHMQYIRAKEGALITQRRHQSQCWLCLAQNEEEILTSVPINRKMMAAVGNSHVEIGEAVQVESKAKAFLDFFRLVLGPREKFCSSPHVLLP